MSGNGPHDKVFHRGKCQIGELLLRTRLRCVDKSFNGHNFCGMVAVK